MMMEFLKYYAKKPWVICLIIILNAIVMYFFIKSANDPEWKTIIWIGWDVLTTCGGLMFGYFLRGANES